jgi:adenine deaminase
MQSRLFNVALGQTPADLVITNGQLVNVLSGEIYPGGVAIAGDRVAATGDVAYAIGEGTQVIDAGGNYIVPGFVEGHIHPESANLTPARFAEVVLCHGTTSVFTDLHEIGVVTGMEGMEAALREGQQTPLKYYWVVPSHVPFSPGLETSGGSINFESIAPALERPDAVGLSEVVSQYVLLGLEDLQRSMEATRRAHKVLAGHAPETKGPAWNAYASTGVLNDHEALDVEDVLERVRAGVHAQLRHNLIVPTLPVLLKAVTEHKADTRLMSLVTDDTTAVALTQEGHLDYLVRLALPVLAMPHGPGAEGIPFLTAIQMVTLNAAASFRMDNEIGSLAPGRYADLNIVTGPEDFRVLKTVAGGKLVAQDGRLVEPMPIPAHEPVLLHTFHLKAPVSGSDLVIPAPAGASSARVHIMRTLPWVPITEGGDATLPVVDGHLGPDLEQDLVHIAVVERHHATGNIGRAFIGGFGLKRGALASSIAHDNHNIVVMGVDPDDMAAAVNRVAAMEGGIAAVEGGQVLAEIRLPVCGLLTDLDAWTLAEQREKILEVSRTLGCTVPEPFMFLSFITLAAVPAFAITDKGFVDCLQQKLIEPVESWA